MTTTPIISTRQSLVHFCSTPTIEPNEDGIVNIRPVFLLCVADPHTLSLSHTQLFLLCFYTPSRSPLLTIDMFNHSFYFLFLSLRYTFSFSRSCFPTHSLTHFIELHVNRNETFSAWNTITKKNKSERRLKWEEREKSRRKRGRVRHIVSIMELQQ